MAGDVGESNYETPVFELLPVEEIAACGVSGAIPASNLISFDLRPDLGQQ